MCRMCIRIYIFNFKKQQTNKNNLKTRTKQSKRNLKRKENISGKSIKKKLAAARGEGFSRHPHFRKREVFFFFFDLIKKTPQHMYFPINIAKFLRTPI